jgi:phosphoglycolate phosphatase
MKWSSGLFPLCAIMANYGKILSAGDTGMDLRNLLDYRDIVVQCHDVPDADSIASGFALVRYIESQGGSARLIYGGRDSITKSNLKLMIDLLKIPLEHVEELPPPELLITVDSQYGAGNVTKFQALNIAIFDHHYPEVPEGENTIIFPMLGSCSTLIWDLMRKNGFDFSAFPDVYNALYYGLFTDTHYFSEIQHPLDRDLSEFMSVDNTIIKKLQYSELTTDDLTIVSFALSTPRLVGNIGVLRAEMCDPNILGFSSDIARRVDQFACCIVYCHLLAGLKLSIRSSVREVMANELAGFLSREAGSGGGGTEKAGAYISFAGIGKVAPDISPDDYIIERIMRYQEHFDLVYCDDHAVDFAAAERFKKLQLPVGYVRTTDVFPEGTHIRVRTLEGDIDMISSRENYIMIGIANEVYPIKREKFERGYEAIDSNYISTVEYPPTIIERLSGDKKSLLPYANVCIPRKGKFIRAKKLVKDTKVFSHWDKEKYFLGRIGDYIAAPETDFSDVYIINEEIFIRTYVPLSYTLA